MCKRVCGCVDARVGEGFVCVSGWVGGCVGVCLFVCLFVCVRERQHEGQKERLRN